ncbi:MAG: GTPase HflX [Roseburia sp.]|nr:GTPase HflX [Roseburia sp.]MCM1277489.1 GTPase HflX [Robinsoniella sp.]
MEKSLLVGLNLNNTPFFTQSMEELSALAKACNMEVVSIVEQTLPTANKAFYIGTGKVEEVREKAEETGAEVIVFDNALSPSQLRNLQKELGLPILDRTTLILEIFSTRAKTREARLQVETARLQYMLPRLVGLHEALSRQGGGSGLSNKGAGEKKLELDRRKIEHRLGELRKELEEISKERDTQRKRRLRTGEFQVALVGYTNAGKSTIMNQMVDLYVQDEEKKVLEKDMLFATLETTVRKIVGQDKRSFLLSDTVGFISNLPHNLIKAFRSTLEEVKNADLLLQVVDFSDPYYKEHMAVTEETLKELEAAHIPMMIVYNKADLRGDLGFSLPKVKGNSIYMSAKSKEHIEALVKNIFQMSRAGYVDCEMFIPFSEGQAVSYLQKHGIIKEIAYESGGTRLFLSVSKADFGRYRKFCVNEKM